MVAVLNNSYRWADFELEPAARRLARGGVNIHLTKKPFAILVYLIEHRDRIVTRDELLQEFWDGHDVYEETLTKSIGAIRKALGESSDAPLYIETRWAEGYRFVGDIQEPPQSIGVVEVTRAVKLSVEEGDAAREGDQRLSLPPAKAISPRLWVGVLIGLVIFAATILFMVRGLIFSHKPPRSLAVLPLTNLTGDETEGYLADGMTEHLIDSLSRDSTIAVIAPGSAFAARDQGMDSRAAAKALKVEGVIIGSLQKDGDILRVAVRLIEGESGKVIWTKEFARSSREIFALQDEVSSNSAAALSTRPDKSVTPASYGTSDVEAYIAYLKGRYDWHQQTEESEVKALTQFEAAIQRDPNFALAYCGLSDTYNTLGFYFRAPNETMPKAEEYAAKALALDDKLPDAYFSDASVKYWYRRDMRSAEAAVRKAIELKPDHALAHDLYGDLLISTDRTEEGLAEVRRATELDPLAHFSNCDLGWQFYNGRRFTQAVDKSRRNLETMASCPYDRLTIGQALAEEGDYSNAVSELLAINKYQPDWVPQLAQLGYVYGKAGRKQDADTVSAKLQSMSKSQFVDPYAFAVIAAGSKDKGNALRHLNESIDANSYNLPFLKNDARFDFLKDDPDFLKILRRAGLQSQVS